MLILNALFGLEFDVSMAIYVPKVSMETTVIILSDTGVRFLSMHASTHILTIDTLHGIIIC